MGDYRMYSTLPSWTSMTSPKLDIPFSTMRLDKSAKHNLAALRDWIDLIESMQTASNFWENINPDQMAILQDLSNDFLTTSGKWAMEILNYFEHEQLFIPPAIGQAFVLRNFNSTRSIIAKEDLLKIYPNPANTIVNIVLDFNSNSNRPTELKIYNSQGQLKEKRIVNYKNEFISLNTSTWTPGIYLIELNTTGSESYTSKLHIFR